MSTFANSPLFRAIPAQTPKKLGDRVRRFKLSDSSEALDGHTLKTSGVDLSRAKGDRLKVIWAHDTDNLQSTMGRWRNVHISGDDLIGDAEFMPEGMNPIADMALSMIDADVLDAASVAFIPTEGKPSKRGPGTYDFSKWLLIEASIVPVPSLPTALIQARAAGINVSPMAAWAERALDEGKSKMSRDELTAIRRAAGASSPRVFPMPKQYGGGFASLGEQFRAIRAFRESGVEDNRLQRAPSGAGEIDPSGGGFLVATNFVEQMVGSIYEAAVIAPLCSRITTSEPLASVVKLPAVDETSRADGSRWGGAASYWAAEAATVSATFPRFRQIEFSAKKLISLVYSGEELFEDTNLLSAHLTRALASELSFKLDQAIIAGTGAGQPLGLINSAATIAVAKEAGQAAGTILKENVDRMWSRMAAPSRKNAVWICNEDALAQIDAGASTYQGIYGASAAGERFPRIKGAPVVIAEQSPALGTVGDLILADLSQYQIIGSDMKTAISADVQFLTHQIVFRFTMRVDGSPLWASPIMPYNGSNTRSPFVTLAAR